MTTCFGSLVKIPTVTRGGGVPPACRDHVLSHLGIPWHRGQPAAVCLSGKALTRAAEAVQLRQAGWLQVCALGEKLPFVPESCFAIYHQFDTLFLNTFY